MDVVNIFLSDPIGEILEPFDHDGVRFTFDKLDCNGPRRLVDGQMWAFVDWVMDECSGLELCRRLRADPRTENSHITMVLEEDDAEDRRRALRAGADDYLVGPLDRTIVLDRVFALQDRGRPRHVTQQIRLGDLVIDLMALQARWKDKAIALRPNEFRLLRFFVENPDRVLTRLELIEGLGKLDPPIDERTVDVWIGRLRRALKNVGAGDILRTVRAMGYVLDSPSGA
ncbi:response regulator transcription factor [Croceicoccus pelagius]|uniref:DNA-binding response regulator n=1 Tax=Croceicoccus pelagius TaxID=1703341 RepID=A0A916YLZ2_9SPHN|nr:response regulator transcription factor [Croceicoccus pelagius]GGD51897.1 DNA-binding response regulator [Croceicoccus pelagius]